MEDSVIFGKNEIVGQKYFKDVPADKLFVTSMFYTLQGEGIYAGKPAFFIRLAKCNLRCNFCFVENTQIAMADGTYKKIADVNVGDLVLSWDELKGEFVDKPVVNKFKNETTADVYRVHASTGKTWCTAEHPFLTSNRGWVEAKDLTPADVLVHFSVKERMRRFNPVHRTGYVRPPMTESERNLASERMQKLWQDHAFRQSNVERMINNNPMKDPAVALKGYLSRETHKKTGLEIKFEQICSGLPIEYIGDGGVHVAHKIPDFIVPGTNKIIEVWDSDARWSVNRDDQWISRRKQLFEKHGFEVLMVPLSQADMKIANHQHIRSKVATFINNNVRVHSVTKIDRAAHVRLFGNKQAPKVVYNIEVQDTHTYVANGLVVHNCDTFFDDGDWMSFDQIEEKIEHTLDQHFSDQSKERPQWTHHWKMSSLKKRMVLVVTGGEPTLQKNLGPFLERMSTMFQHTQIETNGIINQPTIPSDTTVVMSPKCLEKDGKPVKYIQPNQLMLDRADCLKFVMSADPDSPYHTIPDWAFEWLNKTGKPIFCSPMNVYNDQPKRSKLLRQTGTNQIDMDTRSTVDEVIEFWEPELLNMKENEKNHKYAARYCVNNGLNLNLQMHLYAGLA